MIIEIDQKWITEYAILGVDVQTILPKAIVNLQNLSNAYIPKLKDRSSFKIVDFGHQQIDFDKYNFRDIDVSDLANYALEKYLIIYKRDTIKAVFEAQLNEDVLLDILKELGLEVIEVELDQGRNRIYYYRDCPACDTERFYFSFDQKKKKVFVGCYSESCCFHNRKAIDFLGFLQKQYKMNYGDSVYHLGRLVGIDIDMKFQDTPYFTTSSKRFVEQYGYDKETIKKCNVIFGEKGVNPIMYKNRGKRSYSREYVITNRVMDAMRIRKHNDHINIVSLYSNQISDLQLVKIKECIPTMAIIKLALDTTCSWTDIESEIEKLKHVGYHNIETVAMRSEYINFFEIDCQNDEYECYEVDAALYGY